MVRLDFFFKFVKTQKQEEYNAQTNTQGFSCRTTLLYMSWIVVLLNRRKSSYKMRQRVRKFGV